ncbi:GNS1/SUR4 family [Popillia japonica]|uniref:Elongation of very long chain fatty acids protein n=1 Tax=Popillia japonica TaxID=7064 RepID=A0AAW1HRP1_POPJA
MDLVKYYNHVMNNFTDPKTRGWLINKPSLLVPVIAVYWIFCTQIGPQYMKNRPAYKLTRIIQVYNISQVIINTVLAVVGFFSVLHYNWICQPVDYSMDPREVRVSLIGWAYCVTKLVDLLDTVFFVLRKKFNQVSPLHLYHHIIMGGPFIYATNFYATGHPVFPFGLNAIVHILMYFYYFLASLGPKYHKYLWWKRHLTEFQIVQFMMRRLDQNIINIYGGNGT